MAPIGESTDWGSKPAWKLPKWVEPLVVGCILITAMIVSRRKSATVFYRESSFWDYFDCLSSDGSSERLLSLDIKANSRAEDRPQAGTYQNQHRRCCGMSLRTPSSDQFRHTLQSRILKRFPFLMEMSYWILNYVFYCITSIVSQMLFADTGIWNVALTHGMAVYDAEHKSALRFLFPIREQDVQQWFMNNHQTGLTVLNKAYALLHIPVGVLFISWYYYVAPSFNTFAAVRRTITLTNFFAFTTYILYPCMPPRLLPAEYGFLDTVQHQNAESVWVHGKYVNALAAMPSMHFGYAFCVGAPIVYHSGVFRRGVDAGEKETRSRKDRAMAMLLAALGIGYPLFVFVTVVATANHYFLDSVVGAFYVIAAYHLNEIVCWLLPLEDVLLYVLHVDKPAPTTGKRFLEKRRMSIAIPPPVVLGTAVRG